MILFNFLPSPGKGFIATGTSTTPTNSDTMPCLVGCASQPDIVSEGYRPARNRGMILRNIGYLEYLASQRFSKFPNHDSMYEVIATVRYLLLRRAINLVL
jgi:hypothetical protein